MKTIKRVVLIGIDGGGTFFEQTDTPNIDRIFKNGVVSRRTLTEIPTISAECWGSMLHGVDCKRHGLTNSIADTTPYPFDSPYPSVFRVIRAAMPEAKLASFCDWNSINIGIIEDGIGVYKYHAKDYDLIDPAIDYINKNDFTLLYFQFDSVDHAGHEYGYGSTEHLEMITKNDGYIGRVVEAIEKRGWLEDTLIMVEADHGGTPGGSHGGATDAEKYVSFFATGGNVRNAELTDMMVRDTPSIILYVLGIDQPLSWMGHVPVGMFPDCMENLPRPEGTPVPGMIVEREAMEEKGEYTTVFADFEPLIYLSFEKNEELPKGTKMHGKLYQVDGVMGHGMRFDDGYLTMSCPSLKESFSLMGWIRPDFCVNEGIVAATGSDCQVEDKLSGFCFSVAAEYIRLRGKAVSKDDLLSVDRIISAQMAEKWMFVALSVDFQNGKLNMSVNFEEFDSYNIPKDMHFQVGTLLYIGQDEKLDKANRLAAVLDDVCLCRKVLDNADLVRLKEYYKVPDVC
ncbi:MAG: alkaline phosphatase family protein [Roseburia sp.]|nr:alkaline phosphatase family protein [Roseburia sp.]